MHTKSAEVHRVVLLNVDQIAQAAAVLARAFQDGALQSYVVPDAHERAMALAALFTAGIRQGHLAGEVWTTAGEPAGVAVWLRLGQEEMAPDQLEQAGFNELPSIMGTDAFGRFTQYLSYLGPFHKRDVPARHWYLSILGVDPVRQGQGLGAALLQPILCRADEEGDRCYLETGQPKAISFYRQHGFEVVVQDVEPKSGLRFWTFRREPRKSSL